MNLRKPCLKCLVRVTCKQQTQCYDMHIYEDAWKTLSRLCWGLLAIVSVGLIMTTPSIPVILMIMAPVAILAGWVDIHHMQVDLDIKRYCDIWKPRKFY